MTVRSVGASIAKAYIYIAASLATYTGDAISEYAVLRWNADLLSRLVLLTAIGTWNFIEVQIGIMAACAPPMRPILSDLVPRQSFINLSTHSATVWLDPLALAARRPEDRTPKRARTGVLLSPKTRTTMSCPESILIMVWATSTSPLTQSTFVEMLTWTRLLRFNHLTGTNMMLLVRRHLEVEWATRAKMWPSSDLLRKLPSDN